MTKVQTNSQGKVYITSGGKALLATESGGGDTIFLPNESGATINAGDKVLFTLGSVGTDTPTAITYNKDNTQIFNPIGFFDNSAFVLSIGAANGYLVNRVNDVWTSDSASSLYSNWGAGGLYHYYANGDVCCYGRISSSTYGYFLTKNSMTKINNWSIFMYIGMWGDTSYVFGNNYGKVYSWNRSTNTTTEVFDPAVGTDTTRWGRIFGNKCLLQSNNGCKLFEISNATTFTQLSTISLNGNILYATGLNTGDYVFVTDNINAYQNNSSTPQVAHLICYQVQSNNTLVQVTVPALAQFESTNCFVCYDNRNNVLSVGTSSGAYFYQFDTTVKTFSQIDVTLSGLPTTVNSFPYKTQMSPDKSTIVVVGKDTSTYNVNVYTLTSDVHSCIVPNSQYNYNLVTSFTGIATGETDTDGNYEIKTVLPDVVDTLLVSNVEPDEVIITGGAE